MRVSQLDSHILDSELLALLSANLDSALSLYKSSDKYSPALKTLLRAVIWKLGIWDHGTTYGAQMQQLRYSNLTTPKKLILGLISVFGPLVNDILQQELSPRYRRIATNVETCYEFLSLLNFVSFIAGRKYDSPWHRLLRIKLYSSTIHRAVSFEFLNRQLIWSQFTEFLVVFLPLLNLPRLKMKWTQMQPKSVPVLAVHQCAICFVDGRESGIVVPYKADCGDIYCYACVMGQLEIHEGEGWECLRCHQVVKSAEPYAETDDTVTVEKDEIDAPSEDEAEEESNEESDALSDDESEVTESTNEQD